MVEVPFAAVGAVGVPVNAGLTTDAKLTQVFAPLYAEIMSVLLLYQSCPRIGCSGAVELAKFSSK